MTEQTPTVSSDIDNALTVEIFLDALQDQDFDTADALLADDLVYQNVGFPTIRGRARVMKTDPRHGGQDGLRGQVPPHRRPTARRCSTSAPTPWCSDRCGCSSGCAACSRCTTAESPCGGTTSTPSTCQGHAPRARRRRSSRRCGRRCDHPADRADQAEPLAVHRVLLRQATAAVDAAVGGRRPGGAGATVRMMVRVFIPAVLDPRRRSG